MELSERLKELRTNMALTQTQVAKMSVLSTSYISDLERGRTEPSLETLRVLAEVYEVSVIDLLVGVDWAGKQTVKVHSGIIRDMQKIESGLGMARQVVNEVLEILE